MQFRNLFFAAALAILPACASMKAAHDPASDETTGHFNGSIKVSYNYLVYLPRMDREQKLAPTIVFLHGSGERGTNVWDVARHGPPKLVKATNSNFPFIVLSPQCPPDHRWQANEVITFVKAMEKKYPIDPDRVYLTGLSMGGAGTWSTLLAEPDLFAAAVPICGRVDTNELARIPKRSLEQVRHLPIWIFHGAKDSDVPVKYSEDMAAALEKLGSNVKLTVYPDAPHNSWTRTYANPELYDWLLAQNRKNNQASQK